MGNFASDLRHSIRILIKTPGFTAIAVAALALGIGANTAIFSVVNTVLLQPLPYTEPDRIMRIQRVSPEGESASISIPKYMAWKSNNQVFDAMTLYDFSGPGLNLGTGDHPEQVKGITSRPNTSASSASRPLKVEHSFHKRTCPAERKPRWLATTSGKRASEATPLWWGNL